MHHNGNSINEQSKFTNFLKGIKKWFVNAGKTIGAFFTKVGKGIARFFVNVYNTFVHGGWRTKVSHAIMGSGHMLLGRPIKGLIYLVSQIGYFIYMFLPNGGFYWLGKFKNLGDVAVEYEQYCTMIPTTPLEDCDPDWIDHGSPIFRDNSMLIMLFGVATILITLAFLTLFFMQARGTYLAEKKYEAAKAKYNETLIEFENVDALDVESADEIADEAIAEPRTRPKFKNPLPTFSAELKSLLNDRFHFTTLTLPAITISTFTILPLVFMILLAFTNYNVTNGPPNSLFTWVGLDTFKRLFTTQGTASFGDALWDILKWTFVWAIFATATNYILGLLLAMIINRRSIRAKKVWRTIFVISIAIPQFVTLLLMNQLLQDNGPLNWTLRNWGLISKPIKFLSDPKLARLTVILVNIWVGVPYTMLITSGILMNIPNDLYESARIDGAGPVRQFVSITLPYMLFVTGPYLITAFIGNINNFNVIFFLTGGGPSSGQISEFSYGRTDILITWLYNLTVGGNKQEYAIGSALGIFIFIISATITLLLYSRTAAAQQEGDFS